MKTGRFVHAIARLSTALTCSFAAAPAQGRFIIRENQFISKYLTMGQAAHKPVCTAEDYLAWESTQQAGFMTTDKTDFIGIRQSPHPSVKRRAQLAALIPEAFCEGQLDVFALKRALGGDAVIESGERYLRPHHV